MPNLRATLFLAGVLMLATLGTSRALPPAPPPPSVAPHVWEATADGTRADALVLLNEQADLSQAQELPTPEERRRYVYDTLRRTALRSQAGLRAKLDAAGVNYRPFYVVNMIALQGDRVLLAELAARPEVARIVANPSVRQEPPERHLDGVRSQAAQAIEWNIKQVNADDVWALGYTGEGVVVAGQDTGYDWDHPALIEQYRGYDGATATHDYNWHDAIHSNDPSTPAGNPCGFDVTEPCDDRGHGTHTMGTVVGDDGGANQIGVAPGAEWIGCRNMEEGWGTPATYIECFEFFLAPYPIGGDPFTEGEPSLAPHVINNSWSCPQKEGCVPDTLQAVVENVRAAGIMVAVSAGNTGYECSSSRNPPAIYDAAFSVGATNSGDNIASFSARGPVTVDDSGRLKPDISAPGVSVRSSFPGAGYGGLSGTSMAAPHVAGAAALLWSAAPQLVGDVDTTEEILSRTARPQTTTEGCGGDGSADVPNNVYGWGILDALAATPQTWVSAAGQVQIPEGLPIASLRYTLVLTNVAPISLTDVIITDTIPVSTTLSWVEGDYEAEGRTVRWELPSLHPGSVISRTLEVTLSQPMPGTQLTNLYELRAGGPPVSLGKTRVDAVVPSRILLFPLLKNVRFGEQ